MMSNKKYEFTNEVHPIYNYLKRIRAVRDFGNVKKGDIGGFIRCEKNLSHDGNAWVGDDVVVMGNTRVSDDAWVYGNVMVSGNAIVSGNARVSGDVMVSGDAKVSGNARVSGDTRIYGDAVISGDAFIYSDESMYINESCNNEVIYNGHKSRYLTMIYNTLKENNYV